MKLQHCTVQIRCRRYFGIMELLLGGGKDFCGRKNMSPENIPKRQIPGERGSVTFFAAWGQYSGNDKCPEKYIYMTWGRFPNALICDFSWIAILVFWVICFLSYHGTISSITISKILFQRKIHSTLCYPCLCPPFPISTTFLAAHPPWPHPSFNLFQSSFTAQCSSLLVCVTDWEEHRSWSKMRQGNVFLIHWVRIRPWDIFCGCLSCVSLTPLSTNGHTSLQLLSGGSQPYFSNFSSPYIGSWRKIWQLKIGPQWNSFSYIE